MQELSWDVRFEASTPVNIETIRYSRMWRRVVCWISTNVSEEPVTFILRVGQWISCSEDPPKTSVPIYQTAWHHIPEVRNLRRSWKFILNWLKNSALLWNPTLSVFIKSGLWTPSWASSIQYTPLHTILWHTDPLLRGDSVNNNRCYEIGE
jgi:hypothetical protein